MVSPLHCAPYPWRLLADGHIEGVDVGHLGGDDGRQLRVSQFPREEGARLVGERGGRCQDGGAGCAWLPNSWFYSSSCDNEGLHGCYTLSYTSLIMIKECMAFALPLILHEYWARTLWHLVLLNTQRYWTVFFCYWVNWISILFSLLTTWMLCFLLKWHMTSMERCAYPIDCLLNNLASTVFAFIKTADCCLD